MTTRRLRLCLIFCILYSEATITHLHRKIKTVENQKNSSVHVGDKVGNKAKLDYRTSSSYILHFSFPPPLHPRTLTTFRFPFCTFAALAPGNNPASGLFIPALTASTRIPVEIAGEYADTRFVKGGRGSGGIGSRLPLFFFLWSTLCWAPPPPDLVDLLEALAACLPLLLADMAATAEPPPTAVAAATEPTAADLDTEGGRDSCCAERL